MELKGNLVSVRDDVRVLDATLRDGGLCNDFYSTDEFVQALYETNVQAGVDYMEMGYKASKRIFSQDKFGKWKFCDDDDIYAIVGENNTDLKLSIMADVGRCDYHTDFRPRSDSPIDLVRIATYIDTIHEAIAMIEDAANKGYETTCNIMAIPLVKSGMCALPWTSFPAHRWTPCMWWTAMAHFILRKRAASPSYIWKYMGRSGKLVGVHAHNNQQCAFANTIEAMSIGVSYVDGTVCGMGRGAGNCSLEGLLGFFKNPRYQLDPVLRFIEQQMLPPKKAGIQWGYDIPCLITGLCGQHPRTAIAAVHEGDTHYADFYQMLLT